MGDFNAHSPVWNAQCRGRVNAKFLEQLINQHSLYINNTLGEATRYKQTPGILIINLALSSQALGPLETWEIN